MPNSPTRSINYTPRVDQWTALERCSRQVREALYGSVIALCARSAWKYEQKHGTSATLRWIAAGNRVYAERPLIPARGVKGRPGYVPAVPSTFTALNIKPL